MRFSTYLPDDAISCKMKNFAKVTLYDDITNSFMSFVPSAFESFFPKAFDRP
ncbi:hypothetical protein A343_2074 [Porphyromonas gingivalis JCVI SC001]|nr:hypothetical protein A343_2074 [Porphyromonas gingivalis JCVI SC001]